MINFYICLILYSFVVMFLGWMIGVKDGTKRIMERLNTEAEKGNVTLTFKEKHTNKTNVLFFQKLY